MPYKNYALLKTNCTCLKVAQEMCVSQKILFGYVFPLLGVFDQIGSSFFTCNLPDTIADHCDTPLSAPLGRTGSMTIY